MMALRQAGEDAQGSELAGKVQSRQRRDKIKDNIADVESRKSFAVTCGRAAGSQGPGSGVSGDLWWKEAGRGCLVTEDQCINL